MMTFKEMMVASITYIGGRVADVLGTLGLGCDLVACRGLTTKGYHLCRCVRVVDSLRKDIIYVGVCVSWTHLALLRAKVAPSRAT